MNVDDYLKRINCDGLKQVSFENLILLHENHLLNVAFENFDVTMNKKITMDMNETFNKVVYHNRGGFCFELNKLFGWLLKQLGYNVEYLSCQPHLATTNDFIDKWFTHIICLVNINNVDYLCDVAFTNPLSLQRPVEFKIDAIQQHPFARHRIIKFDTSSDEPIYVLQGLLYNQNQWSPLYKLDSTPQPLHKFQEMLDFIQVSFPRFTNRTICKINGNKSVHILAALKYKTLLMNNDGTYEEKDVLLNDKDALKLVQSLFKIKIDKTFFIKDIPLD